jgi:integrase
VVAARAEASDLKRRIDRGDDPLGELESNRDAKTVADLAKRFEAEHLQKKRASTQTTYRAIIANDILPTLKTVKVADVTFEDVDALHTKITARGAPYRANRVLAVLSKMFALAIRWKWRSDNPVRGVERNQEQKRRRYLRPHELMRLVAVLASHRDQQAADIIHLLLLTGARSGEVRTARWVDIDLEQGVWTKPGATTKQKTEHRIPLSSPARELLLARRKRASDGSGYVFPGRSGEGCRGDINHAWSRICVAAEITDARIHDLRHTFASVLASEGMSLPVIGELLGHTQPVTTARYAHLFDDRLRAATELAGTILNSAARKR